MPLLKKLMVAWPKFVCCVLITVLPNHTTTVSAGCSALNERFRAFSAQQRRNQQKTRMKRTESNLVAWKLQETVIGLLVMA